MKSSISLAGIDQAIANLEYRKKNSPKYKLLHCIRKFYSSDKAVSEIKNIDPNELIRRIWGDQHTASRKKNFTSIRSSINADLNRLYETGMNPEGIIINASNVFDMSETAKSNVLNSFSNALQLDDNVSLDQISDLLQTINQHLSQKLSSTTESSKDIEKIKDILSSLSKAVETSGNTEQKHTDNFLSSENVQDKNDSIEPSEDDSEKEIDIVDDQNADDEITEEFQPDDEEFEEIDEQALEEIDDAQNADIDDILEPGETDPDHDDDDEILELDDDTEVVDDDNLTDELSGVTEADDDEFEEVNENDLLELEDDDDEILDLTDEDLEDDHDTADPRKSVEAIEDNDISNLTNQILENDQLSEEEKNRLLSERFNQYLGAMEKYYNQYIIIPAGRYRIGREHPSTKESSAKSITLPEYYMGKFPVTNALFEIFINETGYITTAEKQGYGTVFSGRFKKSLDKNNGNCHSVWKAASEHKEVKGACWYQPFGPGSNLHNKRNHPVVQVSFKDAAAFAAWIGKRLPTEIEWEAAARTKEGCLHPWRSGMDSRFCNIELSENADTTPVDHYPESENDFGITDTIGNVMEWTSEKVQPEWVKDTSIPCFAARGGSWMSDETINLCSRTILKHDFSANNLGFRCIADIDHSS